MPDRLKEIYRRYKRPVFVLLSLMLLSADRTFFYNLLGGVTYECSRCPMPPMNAWQKFLFVTSGLIMYACVIWMFFIYLANRDTAD